MPKGNIRATRQSHYGLDEAQLVEFVKRNPIMYEPNLREDLAYKAETLWELLAGKLNAPVDVVKKQWLNVKETYSRRKSLRSGNNLDFLPASSSNLLNDDSCTSSNCSSPKQDVKRTTRSVSQLSTASESDRTNSTLVSNSTMKQPNPKSRSRMSTTNQKDDESIHERQSVESNVRRFQAIASKAGNPRFTISDTSFTLKEPHGNDETTITKWLPDTSTTDKNKAKKQNSADSTRAFFESMAMTVLTFPQHIQATLKVRICNLVGDAEYELTIPKTM